jgi:hypothetical protein
MLPARCQLFGLREPPVERRLMAPFETTRDGRSTPKADEGGNGEIVKGFGRRPAHELSNTDDGRSAGVRKPPMASPLNVRPK